MRRACVPPPRLSFSPFNKQIYSLEHQQPPQVNAAGKCLNSLNRNINLNLNVNLVLVEDSAAAVVVVAKVTLVRRGQQVRSNPIPTKSP